MQMRMFVLLKKISSLLNVMPMLYVSDLLGSIRPILPKSPRHALAYGQAKAGRMRLVTRCGIARAYAAQIIEFGTSLSFMQLPFAHLGRKATETYSRLKLSTTRLCAAHWAVCIIQLPFNMSSSNYFAHSQYIRNRPGGVEDMRVLGPM
jgi:hypothetical protein